MKLFEATKINLWKNTVSTTKWFYSLEDKHLMKFVMFDIEDFYLSIPQDLLNKALNMLFITKEKHYSLVAPKEHGFDVIIST